MVFSMFAVFAPPRAEAVQTYNEVYGEALQKLNEWNVIQGYSDGQLHPERYVTRAQFVAMVNRAYGYRETGSHPFSDVPADAWYANDIGIAYNAGYFTGTSSSTASPNTNLSRQQAMTLLAKNMRLESVPGEVTEFRDGNAFAPYASGYVKACVQKGLVGGYPDGTF
ncbi:MAG: S-layer homology domain-containing protein, partial [Oscillibacter sp.]|nr:S-layer homology domain-containing protein [Oscillibacter sp.]